MEIKAELKVMTEEGNGFIFHRLAPAEQKEGHSVGITPMCAGKGVALYVLDQKAVHALHDIVDQILFEWRVVDAAAFLATADGLCEVHLRLAGTEGVVKEALCGVRPADDVEWALEPYDEQSAADLEHEHAEDLSPLLGAV
jgi:hypothetical protein